MTPTEWDLLKQLEKEVEDLQRRVKGLEWLARGDVEELPEEEWWGDKFNKAVDIVKRLARAEKVRELISLQNEAAELMSKFPKTTQLP